MRKTALTASLLILLSWIDLSASGPIGVYGIIEKVVFEPNEQAPERIQFWGAFAFVDGGLVRPRAITAAKKGYLYFSMPASEPAWVNPKGREVVLREWRDLKSMAGTGQAVGFGSWIYIGAFGGVQPDRESSRGIYTPSGGNRVDLRVRPAAETSTPVTYLTNTGVVKVREEAIVSALRDALRQ